MSQEELEAGGPEPTGPSRRRSWTWALVGAAVLAVGAIATGVVGVGTRAPEGELTSSTISSPRVFTTTRPGPRTYLDVSLVCPPRTDGRRTLTVSFELMNVGGVGVRVLDVRPTLPLAGLTAVGRVRSGGTCARPGREGVGRMIAVGETQLYTMTFRLPGACPKPYPVQASYRIDANEQEMTALLPLLPDLGELTFDACPRGRSRT